MIALAGYSLFAVTFVLSARIKYLERFFGGLDKMYQAHHRMALVSFILIFLHPFMLASRWLPEKIERFLLAIFPLHHRSEVNLGSYALWGIIILMFFTLVVKLPYRVWKISHKFMGLFFILMLIHTFQLTATFSENPFLWIYLCLISCMGLLAFVYQTLLFNVFNKGLLYEVDFIERFNERIMNIKLSPCGENLNFVPGQFCFFSFDYSGISAESHPFTLISGEKEKEAEIMVKTLGDYTRKLYDSLKPGAKVRITGPYGCFSLYVTEKKQVWIAGGVGIAPFISWIRSLKQGALPGLEAELYYCVHRFEDAAFFDELTTFQQSCSCFKFTLICTGERDRLKVTEIREVEEREFFMCGPSRMCKPFVKELKRLGVPAERIQYENFDF